MFILIVGHKTYGPLKSEKEVAAKLLALGNPAEWQIELLWN